MQTAPAIDLSTIPAAQRAAVLALMETVAALVSSVLRKDPFTGTVFVFRSRKADRLKLLFWDGTGLVMAYKRLEDATFTWPAIKDGVIALNHA